MDSATARPKAARRRLHVFVERQIRMVRRRSVLRAPRVEEPRAYSVTYGANVAPAP